MAHRWKQDALDLKPDVVSILIGTNDVHYYLERLQKNPAEPSFDIDAWDAQYRKLLDDLQTQNPNVRIVLGTPFVAPSGRLGHQSDFALRDSLVQQLAQRVIMIASDYHAVCVPFHSMFDQLIKSEPRNGYWIWDGLHPTAAGHRRMADLWIKTVGLL